MHNSPPKLLAVTVRVTLQRATRAVNVCGTITAARIFNTIKQRCKPIILGDSTLGGSIRRSKGRGARQRSYDVPGGGPTRGGGGPGGGRDAGRESGRGPTAACVRGDRGGVRDLGDGDLGLTVEGGERLREWC